MRHENRTVRRPIVATVAILALVATGVGVGVGLPAERAVATTAGTPGTPQPPTALFTEDFSGQNAASNAIKITSYQGTPGSTYVPGVSGANSETYYADPRWADGLYCNGYIVNGSTTPAPPGWNSGCPISGVQILANAMGQYQGYSTTAAAQNQAVTAYTASGTVPGIQLRTNTAIPAVPGHFYQVTSIVAATNCVASSSGNPAETLSLFINGVKNVLASQLDPCHYPGAIQYGSGPFGPTMVAGLTSAAIKVPSTGTPTVGMQLENQSAVVAGNDGAFDLPQILDVTPQLDKAFSPATIASGQTSTLTFTITNTSELAAKNGWSFHDDLPAGVTATGVNATTCSGGTVTAAAGATSVAVANGSLNQGQNACTVTVQVTATVPGTYTNGPGNFPEGTAGLDGLNPPADAPLTVTPPASLIVTKASSTTAITRVGQVVTYKFVVTNRSQVTLHGISVVDAQTPPATQAGLSAILCETQTLAPQASTTCTARYTVTQADLDNGSLSDTATASGLDPGGATVTAPPATLTITSARPAIAVVKSTTTTLASAVGQQIPYTFVVTNTGNVTLFGVSVSDTATPPASQANMSAVTCPNPALAPGESQSCTGTYTATLADLQNGTLADSATASGAPEGGAPVTSDPSDLSIPTQLPGSLTIRKATTTAAVTAIGQVIPYTFLVTNNSTVVVNNVVVTDTVEAPSLPANLTTPTCPQTTLAPGASTTCTASYRVTSADVNAGVVADHARASGTDPVGTPVLSSPSRVELFSPVSALTIVKSTTATSVSAVGQLVPYAFLVTNTGNQVLTSVAVADTQVPPGSQANMSAISCPQTTLNPGASMTCTGVYQVTAADLGNGSVNDFATASGKNPGGATVTSPQSAASVNATPAALTMVKASSTNSFNAIGQPVRYTFTVTNNSSTTYRNIGIQDTQVAPATQSRLSLITCDRTTLAPSQVAVCSATYSVTAADITNGWLSDFATATGVDVADNTYTTARSSTIIPAIQSPAITVTKSSTVTRITALGQEVPYVFTVRNTGNVDVTDVTVADTQTPPALQANMSAVTCPPGALAPGDTVDCTGTYTVTQADLDHGLVADTATARATDPTGAPVDAPQTRLRITTNPALTIEKSSTTTLITSIGQQVPYEFLVTNIRTTPVSNVRVDDTQVFPSSQAGMGAIVCDDVTLAPRASTICRGTYTVTAADIANGAVDDSAVAEGTDSNGLPLPPSEPSDLSIPAQQSPQLTVAKSSSTSVITSVGQTLTYRFLVTNTGNVRIDGVDVEDVQLPPAHQADLSPIACPYPSLEPGQSQTCTATYTVSQADVTNGSVADFAIATGTAPGGAAVRSTPSALSIPAPSTPPAISIVKSSSSQGVSVLNEQIPYSFEVTNNSAVTLTEVRVVDTQAPPASQSNLSSVICPFTTLAAGASMTCTATYTTTQPDFDHGRVDDSAVATGRDPGGTVVQSSPSTFVVLVDPVDNGLTIDKRSSTTAITQIGQQVPYQFLVTNTGTQTITALSVTDVVASPSTQSNLSAVSCPAAPLAPNATTTCTATYTTTEADLNNGSVVDSATAHGTTPAGLPIHSGEDALSIPAIASPALTVVKSSTTTEVLRVGQQVPYRFVVTNTGNVTLGTVSVTDTVAPPSLPGGLSAVTCPTATLSPGATTTCTATYTVTQADIDHGTVDDSATASGTRPATPADPNPGPTTSGPSAVSLPVVYQAELRILKSTTTSEVSSAGQTIPYTFLVTNTGNLTISGVQVTDTVSAPSDPAGLSPVTCPDTVLTPGASTSCTASYTITQADVDSGRVHDSAVAAGQPAPSPGDPTPGTVTSTPSEVTVPVASGPALTVVKSSPQTASPPTTAGDQIEYRFLVENTGNQTLTDVTVDDAQVAPATQANLSPVTCPSGALAPGGQLTCTATYTITQADIDNGSVTDRATASGRPPTTPQNPNPPRVTSPEDSLTVSSASAPAITVVKSSPTTAVTQVGQVVPYEFLVTNTGNVTLSGIAVDDQLSAPSDPANLSGITCPQTTLAPSGTTICTATYTVTQADIDNGSVADGATASGVPPATPADPTPQAVLSPVSTVTIAADQIPGITLVKSSPTTAIAQAGQQVPYEFLVTNTGTVTLSQVVVDDLVVSPSDPANLSAITCPQTTLAPAGSMTCTATYTVTQADVDNGSVSDIAIATGTPPATPADPNPPTVSSPPSAVTLPVADQPALTVAKSSTTSAVTQVGQVVPYELVVTNTGNVTLTGITVDDQVAAPSDPANLSAITCPVTTLAPAATTTCTATYTVTQADVDNGSVTDHATVSGTPPATPTDPNPPTVDSPIDTLTIDVSPAPALTVAKSSTTTAVTQVGQVVPYEFLVTNTGNVTLTGIAVDDQVAAPSDPANLSAIICPQTTLAPAATATCTATYTVTQADVDSGSLTDDATASGTPPATPTDPNPPTVGSPFDTLSIDVTPAPGVTVAKSSTTTAVSRVGQVVPYAFLVTNTGNVTLTGIAVDDQVAAPSDPANLSAIDCPVTTLAPAATTTCTATYTVTQADVDNGSVTDAATASGTPPATPTDPNPPAVGSPIDTLNIDVTPAPAVTVVKSSTTTAVSQVGQVVPYAFLVTNTGNVTLTGIAITDQVMAPSDPADLSAITCPQTALAPAATTTCTATYTVSQADVDNGSVSDSATASGTPPATPTDPNPPTVGSPISAVTLPVADQPALTVAKSSTVPAVTRVGQVVPYQFLVTNTGNVTLTGIMVDDEVAAPSDPANLSAISCPQTTLAPAATTTCTATYTVTQADVDHGSLTDSATGSGVPPATPTDPTPPPVDSPIDTLTIDATPAPALTVAKSSTTTAVTQVGQQVPYAFLVTNTGNVTLTGIAVDDQVAAPSDPANLSAISCPQTTLAPAATTTCTATYTATQADIDNGSVTDGATASGTPPATPTDPNPPAVGSPVDTLTIDVAQDPALTVAKSSTTNSITRVGQQMPYDFVVTNTGNVTLTGITVDDEVAAPSDPANLSPISCARTTLPPQATTTCAAAYTVTQTDVDNGSVTDTATSSGTPPATPADPNPPAVGSPDSTVTIAVADQPALTVVKSSPQSATPPTVAGAVITYDFLVENTGNVTLDDIQVDDIQDAPASQGSLSPVTCPSGPLAPAAQLTCTATYTVTQADVDHGSITDRATASGRPPATPADPTPPRVGSPEDTLTIPSPSTPSLTVDKSSTTAAVTRVGQQVPYSFLVTNTGNVALTAVTVDDQVAAPSDPANLTAVSCPQDALSPAQTMTCTASYTVTQADVDNGRVRDTATATGTPPATPADPSPAPVSSPPSTLTLTATAEPGLSIDKTTDTAAVTLAGQQIVFRFAVQNTGDVTLTGIVVTDTVTAPSVQANLSPVSCPAATLAPGERMTCTATYTVTAADMMLGSSIGDTAVATGIGPQGVRVGSPPSTLTLPVRPIAHLPVVTG